MTDLDLADALIAAQDERIEELEAEKRAQFDECVATSTAYRERAEQAEAENERLRWMLDTALAEREVEADYRTDSEIRDDLGSRWTRREES